MDNKPLDELEEDFLPFSPIEEETDSEIISKNEEENLNQDDLITEKMDDDSLIDTQMNSDIEILLGEENSILNVDSIFNEEKNIFDLNNTEEILNNENNDIESQEIEENKELDNKLKNSETIQNLKKTIYKNSKIIPVVAFLFVSVLGIYIFLDNVNADAINLIKIEEKSKVGYIDDEGEVIVRPKYLYGTDYYKGYAVVKNYNSLYGILDGKGKTEIAFGNIFSASLYKNRYIVSKFTNEGLKMGLLDSNLKEVTRFKYDNLSYSKSGVFMFTENEKMGILNSDGKEIYTYKVDEVDDRNISIEVSNLSGSSTSDLYAKIKINDSSTIINTKTGKEVYKYTLDDINVLDNNVFYIKNDSGNNKYFVIKDDRVIYETLEYRRIRIEDLDSNIAIAIKEDASIDYIDLLTKTKININGNIKYTYSDGVILEEVYNFSNSKNEFTIKNPKKVLGTISDIDPVDDTFVNGYMKINTNNNKYNYVDKKGNIISKKEYETASDFNENDYAVISNNDQCGVINGKGKEIIKTKYDEIIMLDSDLFNNIKKINKQELFIYKNNNKYGIINANEKVVIKAIYDDFEEITTKYPIIKAKYNNEEVIINLNTLKELTVKVNGDVEVYENYIISNNEYYNYNGDLIYSIGG